MRVYSLRSANLTTLRTENVVEHYCEVTSEAEVREALNYAKESQLAPFILGNGSNVFLSRPVIKTLIIKNRIPSAIERLPNGEIWCSSGTSVMEFLRFCLRNSLDAPYFLASLPAEIGGVLAMNAGGSKESGLEIYSFVKSVSFYRSGVIVTLPAAELDVSYRHTVFLDNPSYFIIGANFWLPKIDLGGRNPIKERTDWSRKNQDHSAPNAGTFFSTQCDRHVLSLCYRLFRFGEARFSERNAKWLLNKSKDPRKLNRVVQVVRFLCRATGRAFATEVRIIE